MARWCFSSNECLEKLVSIFRYIAYGIVGLFSAAAIYLLYFFWAFGFFSPLENHININLLRPDLLERPEIISFMDSPAENGQTIKLMADEYDLICTTPMGFSRHLTPIIEKQYPDRLPQWEQLNPVEARYELLFDGPDFWQAIIFLGPDRAEAYYSIGNMELVLPADTCFPIEQAVFQYREYRDRLIDCSGPVSVQWVLEQESHPDPTAN